MSRNSSFRMNLPKTEPGSMGSALVLLGVSSSWHTPLPLHMEAIWLAKRACNTCLFSGACHPFSEFISACVTKVLRLSNVPAELFQPLSSAAPHWEKLPPSLLTMPKLKLPLRGFLHYWTEVLKLTFGKVMEKNGCVHLEINLNHAPCSVYLQF